MSSVETASTIEPLHWSHLLTVSLSSQWRSRSGNNAGRSSSLIASKVSLTFHSLISVSSFVHIHWSVLGEACLALLSVLDAGILYLMATTPNIWTAYVGYLLFRSLYQVSLNVRYCVKAFHPDDDHRGELWDCFKHQPGQLWAGFWHQHIPCTGFSGFQICSNPKKWEKIQVFPSVHFHFLKFMFFSASEWLVDLVLPLWGFFSRQSWRLL